MAGTPPASSRGTRVPVGAAMSHTLKRTPSTQSLSFKNKKAQSDGGSDALREKLWPIFAKFDACASWSRA